jgi:hypothetical protein
VDWSEALKRYFNRPLPVGQILETIVPGFIRGEGEFLIALSGGDGCAWQGLAAERDLPAIL